VALRDVVHLPAAISRAVLTFRRSIRIEPHATEGLNSTSAHDREHGIGWRIEHRRLACGIRSIKLAAVAVFIAGLTTPAPGSAAPDVPFQPPGCAGVFRPRGGPSEKGSF
jgi:hypothetical protein